MQRPTDFAECNEKHEVFSMAYYIIERHDLTIFDEKNHFKEYHFYELYDKHKKYNNKPFMTDFGYGLHQYEYVIVIVNNIHDNKFIEFIVAAELLTNEEKEKLKQYCECTKHTKNGYLNIYEKTLDTMFIPCIENYRVEQNVINRIRKRTEKNTKCFAWNKIEK